LIALHVCARFAEPPTLEQAFKEFLQTLMYFQDLKIIFTEKFETMMPEGFMHGLSQVQGPFILDPGNPFNELTPTQEALESWARYAELTLKRFEKNEVLLIVLSGFRASFNFCFQGGANLPGRVKSDSCAFFRD
jgi:hypothetical protein